MFGLWLGELMYGTVGDVNSGHLYSSETCDMHIATSRPTQAQHSLWYN